MEKESIYSVKCEVGRYCLESCPALEAAQRVINLISACGYICEACKYKHDMTFETEASLAAQAPKSEDDISK